MGNTQSHHAGPHNRLSKPKTNTNSPCLPQQAESPVSVSSRYADLSTRDRQMLKARLTSPEAGLGLEHTVHGDDGLEELAARMQSRLSALSTHSGALPHDSRRNSTSKLASLPSPKLSLVSGTQRVDLDTTMKILYEVEKNSSRQDLAALNQALKPVAPSPSPSPSPAPELKRRISLMNRSSLSLIRRRSLITTPGIATRESPTEGTRRWSSWRKPQLEPEEEAKWTREMMGTSPLTRFAALDLAERSETPTPRAQTPGDMEYTHLGSLKLGSLIVTNGAASPAPSTIVSRRKSNPQLYQEDDYFTSSTRTASPLDRKTSKKWGHSRSKSTVPTKATPLQRNLSISDEIRRAKTLSRCDSPLKVETQSPTTYHDEVETFKMRLRVINKSADTLARAHMAEIPSSPFVDSDASIPKMTLGRDHAHKRLGSLDEGFSESVDDGVSFREEAFRILDGTIFNDSPTSLELTSAPSTPTNAASSSPRKTRERNGRPSPRKADSGYSSGGSTRTKRGSTRDGPSSQPSKEPSVVAEMLMSGDDTASLYTFEQMCALPVTKPLPPLPKPVDEKKAEARPANLQIPESAASHSSVSLQIKSPGTPVSVASMYTVDSQASSMPKHLQRRRPSQPELPIVQSCQPIPDGTIPSIPVNVRAQFVRRLSEQPDMECLTKTYLSKDHIKSTESTIDSPTKVSLEFTTSKPSPESRGRHHTHSHTERPTERPHSNRRSLSLFRTKSSVEKKEQKSKDEDITTTIDFGTAAEMLGQSPYDAARPSLPTASVTEPAPTTHQRKSKSALPRAKSMVHMDSQTAADFARMRSKDLALGPPEMLERPKIYHDSHLNAEARPSSKRSRHSVYSGAAPASTDCVSSVRDASPEVVREPTSAETRPGPGIRAKSTGRGVVVSQLVEKYDKHGKKIPQPEQNPDWDAHARLWSQRRKSIGEGLRQQPEPQRPHTSTTPHPRASSQSPEELLAYDRYSGGLDYGYEGRGYGIGGSAGTRQLHSYSYASRKSMHYSNQYGVDLSDVPVFVQRC